jgi:hypothetical protein
MSDFGKRIAWQMRNSEAKHDAPAQQEFADVRQHVYLHLSPEKRKQFKEDMKALVEVANRLSERGIRIEAEWSHDMLDDEGNYMGGHRCHAIAEAMAGTNRTLGRDGRPVHLVAAGLIPPRCRDKGFDPPRLGIRE